jgi:hypothetical protein
MKKETYIASWLSSNIILAIYAFQVMLKMPIQGLVICLMLFINIYSQLKYNK